MRTRSGIILIKDDRLALMERCHQGRHYFSFPGGGLEESETPEQAAIREAEEELGIRVQLGKKAAEVYFGSKAQHYFLVESFSGKFGTGDGEEYGEVNPLYGTYHPMWMPLTDVPNNNVLPRELAALVVRSVRDGWPSEPVIIVEKV
jgi:8-oxo-dGTP diphosphatase